MSTFTARIPQRFICAVLLAFDTNVILCPDDEIWHVTGATVWVQNTGDAPNSCYVTINDVLFAGVFLQSGFASPIQWANASRVDIPVYPGETIRASCEGETGTTGQAIVWGYAEGYNAFPAVP